MTDFMKLIGFCVVAWALTLAVPIAAVLIGSVLALWVLYFLVQVANEDPDDDRTEDE